MRKRGGILGPKKTVTTSSAVGFWDLTTLQQELGAATWPNTPVFVNYLVVAGGGGGGKGTGAGGGGGGLRSTFTSTGGGGTLESPLTLTTSATYSIVVGSGGAGGSSGKGAIGGNTTFSSITAIGGGGGGSGGSSVGDTGGSGGGSGPGALGGTNTANQGFAGGGGSPTTSGAGVAASGGGGGAGAVGGTAINGTAGNGGSGVAVSITSSSITYAGGGAGSIYSGDGNLGVAGSGGSGGGGSASLNAAGGVGGANLGGGGGGGALTNATNYNGGAGGSGVVILRYSNLYTLNIGAGLSYSTQTVNDDKVTTFTSGSGSISLSPAPVTTGDYESIATVLVGPAGASTVTFSNIPQIYKHLQIRLFAQTNRATYGRDVVKININSDTGNNYSHHELFGDGSGAFVNQASTTNVGHIAEIGTGVGSAFGVAVIDFLDYANTSKYKTVRSLFGGDHNGVIAGYGGTVGIFSTLWQSNSALSSITFAPLNGTQFNQYSHFALYGIRG